jgi:hypothetical protein
LPKLLLDAGLRWQIALAMLASGFVPRKSFTLADDDLVWVALQLTPK